MKKKFCSNIIFTKTPLKSKLYISDFFQIYPLSNEDAPVFEHATYFPVVVEFWIDENENPSVPDELEDLKSVEHILGPTINQFDKLNKIARLLSVLTNHRFISEKETDVKWGIPFPDLNVGEEEKEKIENSPSIPFIPTYHFKTISESLKIYSFSVVDFPDPLLVEHKDYFTNDPFENKKAEIKFPNTIYDSLVKYLSLDNESQNFVDSVCHLICNGIDIEPNMKSLSFLAFVSAVESIVNREYRIQNSSIEFECRDCQTVKTSSIHCKKCDRPIWGVKAKFREFLKTYVAYSPESIAKFNKIYNLRSEIVHNGLLLLGDKENDWIYKSKSDKHWQILLETKQMAKLSIIHYLLIGPGKAVKN